MFTTVPIVGFVPLHGERLPDTPATGLDPLDPLVAPGDESSLPSAVGVWSGLDYDVELRPDLEPPRNDEHPGW